MYVLTVWCSCQHNTKSSTAGVNRVFYFLASQLTYLICSVDVLNQNDVDKVYNLAEVDYSLTVDGKTKDLIQVGDEVNFTVSTTVADAEIHIGSCVAFNLDDSLQPLYRSLELVKDGCMAEPADTVSTFINSRWVSTGTSFTFKQFAFIDSDFEGGVVDFLISILWLYLIDNLVRILHLNQFWFRVPQTRIMALCISHFKFRYALG